MKIDRTFESGKRDSDPRPPPWQGGALPLSYFRISEKTPERETSAFRRFAFGAFPRQRRIPFPKRDTTGNLVAGTVPARLEPQRNRIPRFPAAKIKVLADISNARKKIIRGLFPGGDFVLFQGSFDAKQGRTGFMLCIRLKQSRLRRSVLSGKRPSPAFYLRSPPLRGFQGTHITGRNDPPLLPLPSVARRDSGPKA